MHCILSLWCLQKKTQINEEIRMIYYKIFFVINTFFHEKRGRADLGGALNSGDTVVIFSLGRGDNYKL